MEFSNGLDSFYKCIITTGTLQRNRAGGNVHVTLLHLGFDCEVCLRRWLQKSLTLLPTFNIVIKIDLDVTQRNYVVRSLLFY